MKRMVEKKVTMSKGLVITDPLYDKTVKCRYENKQNMVDYHLAIRAEKDSVYGDWFNVAVTILDDTAKKYVTVNEALDSFSYPSNFKVKHAEIGMDTATILIGSNDVYIEEIHTGTDGYLGTVYQLNRPVRCGDKVKNQYCGIVLFATFDSALNSIDDVVQTLTYNFSGNASAE